jgi:hypothetical protein
MLDRQIAIVVKDNHDLDHYKRLFEHYQLKLEMVMEFYNITYPDFIILHIKEFSINTKLVLDNIKNIQLHRGISKKVETKRNFNKQILPLTYNEKLFGSLLLDVLKVQYLNDLIKLIEKNVNKLDVQTIKTNKTSTPMNDYFFNEKSQIKFLLQVIESDTHKVFLSKDKKYLIISNLVNEGTYLRVVFDVRTGQYINIIKDTLQLENRYNYFVEMKNL